MGIKIKNRDPKTTDFSNDDIVINHKEGTLFYKSDTDLIKLGPSTSGSGGGGGSNFISSVANTVNGQIGINLSVNGSGELTGLLNGLTTQNNVKFNHITASGNISSSGNLDIGVIGATGITLTGVPASISTIGEATFGNLSTRTHRMTGSFNISGSFNINGSTTASGDISSSGNLLGNDLTLGGNVTSGTWQGTAIAHDYIGLDAIDGTNIANDAINSEHYTDASIDHAHLANDCVDGDNIADNAVANEHLADNAVDTAEIADNAVTLAKLAGGIDGNIISFDASGDPVAVATGTSGQVLTSAGAGSPPAFADAAGGSADAGTISGSAQLPVFTHAIAGAGWRCNFNSNTFTSEHFGPPSSLSTVWNTNYGDATGVQTLTQEEAYRGYVIPVNCTCIGFQVLHNNLYEANTNVTVSVHTASAAHAGWGANNDSNISIVEILNKTTTNNSDIGNSQLLKKTDGNVDLNENDIIYIRLKKNNGLKSKYHYFSDFKLLLKYR